MEFGQNVSSFKKTRMDSETSFHALELEARQHCANNNPRVSFDLLFIPEPPGSLYARQDLQAAVCCQFLNDFCHNWSSHVACKNYNSRSFSSVLISLNELYEYCLLRNILIIFGRVVE